ncbi:hypothetical protein GCM10027058_24490 [Microbacterium neimengense]
MIRRARSISVLAILAGGAASTLAATQTWIHVSLTDGAAADVTVAGTAAIPVLTPLSLAVLALGAALSIVGRVLRVVLGALTVAAAIGVASVAAPVVFDVPIDAYAPSVTETTGITGDASVGALVASTSVTGWPIVALLAGVLLLAAGSFVLVTGWRWPGGGRKYDAARRRTAVADDAPLDAIDSWDDLSRGDDPTFPDPPR